MLLCCAPSVPGGSAEARGTLRAWDAWRRAWAVGPAWLACWRREPRAPGAAATRPGRQRSETATEGWEMGESGLLDRGVLRDRPSSRWRRDGGKRAANGWRGLGASASAGECVQVRKSLTPPRARTISGARRAGGPSIEEDRPSAPATRHPLPARPHASTAARAPPPCPPHAAAGEHQIGGPCRIARVSRPPATAAPPTSRPIAQPATGPACA